MTIDMSLDKRKLSLTTQSNVNYLLHLLIHNLNTLYMTLGECEVKVGNGDECQVESREAHKHLFDLVTTPHLTSSARLTQFAS